MNGLNLKKDSRRMMTEMREKTTSTSERDALTRSFQLLETKCVYHFSASS